jgi:hypothetical protein
VTRLMRCLMRVVLRLVSGRQQKTACPLLQIVRNWLKVAVEQGGLFLVSPSALVSTKQMEKRELEDDVEAEVSAKKQKVKIMWTIGHSTRPLKEFVAMLHASGIRCVVDIRSSPGSRKYPQYNKEALHASLVGFGFTYFHSESLGGRRKARTDSQNTVWRNASFRGFADYMETPSFEGGIAVLEEMASREPVAFMCSEAVWWKCHRSMVSDFLKAKSWQVMHIMSVGKESEHPYTNPAMLVDGKLTYAVRK